ncbi:MAG: prepilin-type N-terminal cleavage/methylation domain-containing protein [Akkermansiaceae bacterium]|jgi:prepilin-type N-terminal cleavage/methylation domain-containing protein
MVRRGFTLIEMIVVLAITAMVVGTSIYMVSAPRVEEEIREAHSGIEDLVLRARAMAYSYQQPFVVEITNSEARLMPFAQPLELVDEEVPDNFQSGGALRSLDSMEWPVVFEIDPKFIVSIRRWNSDGFYEVDNRTVETWIHHPNSPCEPIAIQLYSEEDDALLSREYHPLTAKAVDLEMAIGNP